MVVDDHPTPQASLRSGHDVSVPFFHCIPFHACVSLLYPAIFPQLTLLIYLCASLYYLPFSIRSFATPITPNWVFHATISLGLSYRCPSSILCTSCNQRKGMYVIKTLLNFGLLATERRCAGPKQRAHPTRPVQPNDYPNQRNDSKNVRYIYAGLDPERESKLHSILFLVTMLGLCAPGISSGHGARTTAPVDSCLGNFSATAGVRTVKSALLPDSIPLMSRFLWSAHIGLHQFQVGENTRSQCFIVVLSGPARACLWDPLEKAR